MCTDDLLLLLLLITQLMSFSLVPTTAFDQYLSPHCSAVSLVTSLIFLHGVPHEWCFDISCPTRATLGPHHDCSGVECLLRLSMTGVHTSSRGRACVCQPTGFPKGPFSPWTLPISARLARGLCLWPSNACVWSLHCGCVRCHCAWWGCQSDLLALFIHVLICWLGPSVQCRCPRDRQDTGWLVT